MLLMHCELIPTAIWAIKDNLQQHHTSWTYFRMSWRALSLLLQAKIFQWTTKPLKIFFVIYYFPLIEFPWILDSSILYPLYLAKWELLWKRRWWLEFIRVFWNPLQFWSKFISTCFTLSSFGLSSFITQRLRFQILLPLVKFKIHNKGISQRVQFIQVHKWHGCSLDRTVCRSRSQRKWTEIIVQTSSYETNLSCKAPERACVSEWPYEKQKL